MSDLMRRGATAPLGVSPVGDASLRTSTDWSEVRDWFSLLKPRVMTLVVFSGLVGLLVAPGPIHPVLATVAILCIAVGAGAAGCINMWYERDIDALMRRTAKRPIAAGRIEPDAALAYGIFLGGMSVVLMGLATNWAAAAWLLGSILFYVFIYTIWLKRRTPQNIVIGGAAGAFPPIIGWVAVTGHLDVLPLILFAIVFAWTPPHFWSLSLWAHEDYERAGVPMLPVVAGARETRRQIMYYTVALAPLTLLPTLLGLAGWVYGAYAISLSAGFLWHAWRVLTEQQDATGVSLLRDAAARRAFRFSLLHLGGLFGALAVDHWLRAAGVL